MYVDKSDNMKEDRLKQFIQDNRGEFEQERAPENIWSEHDVIKSKSSVKKYLLRSIFILSIVLIIVTAYFIGKKSRKHLKIEKQELQDIQFAKYAPQEFVEVEQFYKSQVLEKQALLSEPKWQQQLALELSSLDTSYLELQSDFYHSESNNQAMLMHLMVENYKLRIQLLEIALKKQKQFSKTKLNNVNNELQEH